MRLEDLYPNFGKLDAISQREYVVSYRLRRAEDMLKPSTYKKKKVSSTTRKPATVLTDEEKSVMKLLGLTKKQMLDLRQSMMTEEVFEESNEEGEDCSVLFNEDDYSEEE